MNYIYDYLYLYLLLYDFISTNNDNRDTNLRLINPKRCL